MLYVWNVCLKGRDAHGVRATHAQPARNRARNLLRNSRPNRRIHSGQTGQDWTGQDRTGQAGTGQDRTGWDGMGQDKTGQHRPGHDRTGRTDQTGHDRTGQDSVRQRARATSAHNSCATTARNSARNLRAQPLLRNQPARLRNDFLIIKPQIQYSWPSL